MSDIEFTLKLPPYPCQRPRVTDNGTFYSEDYRDWLINAEAEIRRLWKGKKALQRIAKISTQFYGWSMRPDLDNLFKSVGDACVKAEALKNDNLKVIQHLEAGWEKAEAKDEQRIEVFIDL